MTIHAGPPDRPLDLFWFVPVSGDGSYLGTAEGHRPADFRYLKQIAQSADNLGFKGVLIPTGKGCDDPLVTAAALASHTENLKFLVALRPGVQSPTFAARQSAAVDRLSRGRFIVNIVTGGNPGELAADGFHLPHDERYAHTAEFLSVYRRLLAGERVDLDGRHVRVEGAKLEFPPAQQPRPEIWFGGSSESALDVAAEHADVYLTWGETPDKVKLKLDEVKARAARLGRKIRFGLRIHLIVRETDAEAWSVADRLIEKLPDEAIAAAQRKFASESDSVGQKRQSAQIRGRSREELEIAPNLWAGLGLVRGGAGTALVGSPKTVAARLREYQSLGIETIIASGYPHLEEAYKVAELLFPALGIGTAPVAAHGTQVGGFGASGTGVLVRAAG